MDDTAPGLDDVLAAARLIARECGTPRRDDRAPTAAQLELLVTIGESDGITSRELAARHRISRAAAGRAIGRLGDLGLIRPDPKRGDDTHVATRDGRRVITRSVRDARDLAAAALAALTDDERDAVLLGVSRFADALDRQRRRRELSIRRIRRADNPGMARVIREVMTEHQACGPGFAIHDPEVDDMHGAYRGARARYYVVVDQDDTVVGGGGVGPLTGREDDVCELRKMYFMPRARGLGVGADVLEKALLDAGKFGYAQCYLETLAGMDRAGRLYRAFGFSELDGPMGATGHFACNSWMVLDLPVTPRADRSRKNG